METDLTTSGLGTWLFQFSHKSLVFCLTWQIRIPSKQLFMGVMVAAEAGMFPLASKRLFMWGLGVAQVEINPGPSITSPC